MTAAGLSALERGHRRRPYSHTVLGLAAALGLSDAQTQALLAAARGVRPALTTHVPPQESSVTAASLELASHFTMNRVQAELTSFVGREQQLADLTQDLSTYRLLTLTGVGGVGKTRLALELAARLAPSFTGGVFFVSLAGLAEPKLVLTTIAEVAGVRDDGSRVLLTSVARSLDRKRALLVLDNFEHLLPAAPAIAELIAACPELRVLVTSRAPLRIYGERDITLPPLRVPSEPCYDLEGLYRHEATRLFIERARAVLPAFDVTTETAAAVRSICARLDGLPLAIELAAARVKLLPPLALQARLDRPLDMLIAGPSDRSPRQQTLRGAIEWSYRLLPPAQQALFRAAGAFVGGWTLDGATAIYAAAEADTLDCLAGLLDASLIQQTAVDGEPRFNMLEVVRDYALEQARACGDLESAQRRHVEYFVRLGEQAATPLTGGPEHVSWLSRLRLEQDNLRAALRWCVEHAESDLGVQLAGAVWRYWYLRGAPSEGSDWLRAILQLLGSGSEQASRARALNGAAVLAITQQDFKAAQSLLGESLVIARGDGDRRAEGAVLHNLGALAAFEGDLERARDVLLVSARLRHETGDFGGRALTCNFLANIFAEQHNFTETREWLAESLAASSAIGDISGRSGVYGQLSVLAAISGDLDAAEELSNTALGLARESLNPGLIAWSDLDVAFVRLLRGDFREVERLCRERLSSSEQTINDAHRLATALQLLAASAAECGRSDRALRLFGAASCAWETTHTWYHVPRDALDVWQERARAMLSPDEAQAAFESGRGLTRDQAITYALSESWRSAR